MRAMFGVVSLLVVLAIVGIVASRQLKAVNTSVGAATATPSSMSPAPAGNVREQSQQLQQRVQSDIAGALQQGADRSKEQGDK